MSLGQNIRMFRERLGLSQEELAKRLGYKDRSTIAKIESNVNDITQSKIIAIAEVLQTTPAALMGWDSSSIAPDEVPATPTTIELTTVEQRLIKDFRALNTEGQQKLLEYASDLNASGRYIKTASDNSIPKQA